MAETWDREEEALETSEHEGVREEAAFLERTDDGDYLVYYLTADDVDDVFVHESDDEREIELLYHLSNPDRPSAGD